MICVDNFETGSLKNIEHIRVPEFVHLGSDIIEPFFVDEPVDFVYHLASPASPIDYLRLPLHTLKVGSHGTHHALGLAKAHRARFLLASTSEVYGDPQVHPQAEDYWGHVNPIGPRGVYDEAKRYAEALTMAYHRQQGVDTAIIRIFNTYGARMRPHDGRAIPTFLRQALADRPLTVFGDGSQTRSFCYVDDLIRGIIALAESGEHQPVNIGNPDEFTLLELAQTVIEVTGSRSEIVYEALPTDDPKQRRPGHLAGARAARMGADRRAARGAAAHDRGIRRRGAARSCKLTRIFRPVQAFQYTCTWLRPARSAPSSAAPAPAEDEAARAAALTTEHATAGADRDVARRLPTRCPRPRRASTTCAAAARRRCRSCAASTRCGAPARRHADRARRARRLRGVLLALARRRRCARATANLDVSADQAYDYWTFAFLITALLFARSGLYSNRSSRPGLRGVVSSLFWVMVVTLAYAEAVGQEFSSYYIFWGSLLFAIVIVSGLRWGYDALSGVLLRAAGYHRRTVLVGTSDHLDAVGHALRATPSIEVVGSSR